MDMVQAATAAVDELVRAVGDDDLAGRASEFGDPSVEIAAGLDAVGGVATVVPK